MIKINVMYPNGEGSTFDLEYYRKTHIPLVEERLTPFGLIKTEITRGIAGGAPGSPPPFHCIGVLYFNSAEEYHNGIAAHGPELRGDVPNFTNISPVRLVTEPVE